MFEHLGLSCVVDGKGNFYMYPNVTMDACMHEQGMCT